MNGTVDESFDTERSRGSFFFVPPDLDRRVGAPLAAVNFWLAEALRLAGCRLTGQAAVHRLETMR